MQSIYIGAIVFCISVNLPLPASSRNGFQVNGYHLFSTVEGNPTNPLSIKRLIYLSGSITEISIFDVLSQTVGDKVRVSWKVSGDEENGTYSVERSGNGVSFTVLETFNGRDLQDYFFEDKSPLAGNNFYRIVYSGRDNRKIYSKTVISAFISQESFRAYYAFDGRIMINLDLRTFGIYHIAIVNYMGQAIYKNEIRYDGGKNAFQISPNGTLTPGIYAVMLSGNGIRLSCQILIK